MENVLTVFPATVHYILPRKCNPSATLRRKHYILFTARTHTAEMRTCKTYD